MYSYSNYPSVNSNWGTTRHQSTNGMSFQNMLAALGGGVNGHGNMMAAPVNRHQPVNNYGGLGHYGMTGPVVTQPPLMYGGYGGYGYDMDLNQMIGSINMMPPSFFNYQPTLINWNNIQGMLENYDSKYGENFKSSKKKHVRHYDDEECEVRKPKKNDCGCEKKEDPPHKPSTPSTPSTPTPPSTPSTPHQPVDGSITGDPHFLGADGERYDIHPINGKKYSLIKDENMALNAEFQPYVPGETDNGQVGTGNRGRPVMKKLGLKIGNESVEMETDNRTGKPIIKINGELMPDTDKKGFIKDGFTWDINTKTLSFDKTVNGESWKMRLVWNDRQGNGSFFDVFIDRADLGKNGTTTTGLWGHSVGGGTTSAMNGVGVLRDANGNLLPTGTATSSQAYKDALKSYEVEKLV
jgi:hypothetical protein